jgi:DNA-binding NtrC family response regulator/pSer/pThr/pTyr-binding forkhead associated (FHA) protein
MFKIQLSFRGNEIKELIFDKSIVSIGRHHINDIHLGVYETPSYISRFHAVIVENVRGDFFVRDLGSMNGVLVNGERVYRRILQDGDIIKLSEYYLTFQRVEKEKVILRPATPEKKKGMALPPDRQQFDDTTTIISQERLEDFICLLSSESNHELLLLQLLNGLGEITSASFGYYTEVMDDGFIMPRYTKGVLPSEGVPLPSEQLFREATREKKLAVDYALRDREAQEEILALGMSLSHGRKNFFFYLEVSYTAYQANAPSFNHALLLLLRKAKGLLHRLPQHPGTTDPRQFCWKEKMVFNARQARMAEVFQRLQQTAHNKLNVLIFGETGTGKEVAAHKIHLLAQRPGAFVALNCAELNPDLLADRLFGHVRGAFSNAVTDTWGAFKEADKGTLFLDEIGCLDDRRQKMLLRPLREKEISRLGETKVHRVEVKIIFATNENLEHKVHDHEMRHDFYFGRILEERPPISLPPLRERMEDIPLLVSFFIDMEGKGEVLGIHPEALQAVMSYQYDWPANINELKSVVVRAMTIAKANHRKIIHPEDIMNALYLAEIPTYEEETSPCAGLPEMEEAECEAILRVLTETRGNKSQAAKRLGLSRPTLNKKCSKYGFDLLEFK